MRSSDQKWNLPLGLHPICFRFRNHFPVFATGQTINAKCPHREPNLSELYNIEPLATEDRGPKVKPTWTVLDFSHNYYVKTPDLWAYNSPNLSRATNPP